MSKHLKLWHKTDVENWVYGEEDEKQEMEIDEGNQEQKEQ